MTRAIKNVYLIEADTGHKLLGLLNLRTASDAVRVTAKTSSLNDWQKEARKLELQGKQEQADAIRRIKTELTELESKFTAALARKDYKLYGTIQKAQNEIYKQIK